MATKPSGLRILAAERSITDACHHYRIGFPFEHLRARGEDVTALLLENATHLDLTQWDVLVLPRLGVARDALWWAEALARLREDSPKLKIVWDNDDDHWTAPATNPHRPNQDTLDAMTYLARKADLITVSTSHLANVMQERFDRPTFVLPNLIDPDFWRRPIRRVLPPLTVGVMGGPSHDADWALLGELFPQLAKNHPEVRFVIAGHWPSSLPREWAEKGGTYSHIAPFAFESLPGVMAQIDINLCPLVDDEFNRSKSPIKWFEAAMAGKPSVVSPTLYGDYVRHDRTALVAETPEQWEEQITRLIRSESLRRSIAQRAQAEVLRNHSIHDTGQQGNWLSAYRA